MLVAFKKAFDSVPHDTLSITMLDMGFPAHFVSLLMHLYKRQKAKVKTASVVSGWFSVMKGVQQGCMLSPHLFIILLEAVMRETLDGYTGGLRIGGRTVTNLRYADDVVDIATSQSDLHELVDRLNRASQKYGLEINIDKTKIMATQNIIHITTSGTPVEKVETVTYLGSLFTQEAKCDNDIKAKLGKGQGLLSSLRTLWKSHSIGIATKIRPLQSLVWPVVSYGCESWTLKSTDEDRIKSFEMKTFRQILRVTWMDKWTNDW